MLGPKQILGLKKILSQKEILGQQKILGQRQLWAHKKIMGQKKIQVRKKSRSETNFGSKNSLCQKAFWPKLIVGSKQNRVQKYLGPKKI